MAVALEPGTRMHALLLAVAMGGPVGVRRDSLLASLWPEHEPQLASQSLNTLVSLVRKTFETAISGEPLLLHNAGSYSMNWSLGVCVDVCEFDQAIATAAARLRRGDLDEAISWFQTAAERYNGDLDAGSELGHLVERERLLARYLDALAVVASHHIIRGEYRASMDYAWRILEKDPCREDAHRFLMRSFLGVGQRAQALRQYELCRTVLAREMGSEPETATVEMYSTLIDRSPPNA